MKLEQQVVSLGIAKKLKELGVKQESYFWWYRIWDNTWRLGDTAEQMNEGVRVGDLHSTDARPLWDTVSAFTVAELGKMLPSYINNTDFLYIWKDYLNRWRVDYSQWGMKKWGYMIKKEDTQADAYGKMLIYLLEKKLIKI